MSIIHKKRQSAPGFAGRQFALLVRAFCCLAVFMVADLAAQCGFRDNGYIFQHPYFKGLNWQAALYQSDLFPVEAMCTDKPQRLSMQRSSAPAAMVYTTADAAWMLTTAPLVNNNCICCRPTIEYAEPVKITVPAGVPVQTSLPFHILTRGTIDNDTVLLVAAGSSGKIYCLHVKTSSGAVGTVDSITINLTGQQTITGVWGEPNGTGTDTALWVAGSSGLVRLLPFKNNSWGTAQTLTIDNTETVTSIGNGFAGTASGKIYRRSGASFTLEYGVATSPIRAIDAKVAVGDAGVVLVRQTGTSWRAFSFGTANYRTGNLTGNAQGTAIELLDDKWNYTVQSLYDSTTRISSVQPSEVGAGLNSGFYEFRLNGIQAITVNLRDPDDNRAIPSIKIRRNFVKGGGVDTLRPNSAVLSLLRHNPAAVCTTTQAYFADTLVKVILNPTGINLEANGLRGSYDASCGTWKWLPCKYATTGNWGFHDTLMVTSGKDTLRIVNYDSGAVTAIRPDLSGARQCGWAVVGRRIHIAGGATSAIRKISAVTIAGRHVWQYVATGFSDASITSPELPPGVLLVKADFVNGTTSVKKVSVAGR